jgi:hypothetical protein
MPPRPAPLPHPIAPVRRRIGGGHNRLPSKIGTGGARRDGFGAFNAPIVHVKHFKNPSKTTASQSTLRTEAARPIAAVLSAVLRKWLQLFVN